MRRLYYRALEWADRLSHVLIDPYCQATVFGRHLPGWGHLQLWQHYLCDYYEDTLWPEGIE